MAMVEATAAAKPKSTDIHIRARVAGLKMPSCFIAPAKALGSFSFICVTLARAKRMAPNSIKKVATRTSGTRICRCRVKARLRIDKSPPVLPKSLTLNSSGSKPMVGTQMVPSVALAVPFLEIGMFVEFAASTAQTARVVSASARYYTRFRENTKIANSEGDLIDLEEEQVESWDSW
jgi:hypothetical protein